MATKTEKKNLIRQYIINAAKVYSSNLAGKTFLYVYGHEFFEVSFPTDHFLHLTGVESTLDKKDFYRKAKKEKLTNHQFYFSLRYPYANARKKLPCLIRLSELTTDVVCVLKDLHTKSIIYKLSVTNLEFTLGLVEDKSAVGKKRSNLFLPMSLRVKDKSIENSTEGEIVDYIFSKSASESKYNNLLVFDEDKDIINSVRMLIDEKLLEKIDNKIK